MVDICDCKEPHFLRYMQFFAEKICVSHKFVVLLQRISTGPQTFLIFGKA